MGAQRRRCRRAYACPQTSVSSARCVSSRPRLRMSTRSRPNSIGVRWTSSPSRRTARAARSTLEPAGAQHRLLGLGRRAAQHGLQARDELARAERLGRRSRRRRPRSARTFSSSSPTADSTMIGSLRPLAQRAADLDAVAVGQHEVEDRGVGRLQRGLVERLLRRRGRDHVEARFAQDDLAARAGSAARRRRRGRADGPRMARRSQLPQAIPRGTTTAAVNGTVDDHARNLQRVRPAHTHDTTMALR